jgi:hypothetical protein
MTEALLQHNLHPQGAWFDLIDSMTFADVIIVSSLFDRASG